MRRLSRQWVVFWYLSAGAVVFCLQAAAGAFFAEGAESRVEFFDASGRRAEVVREAAPGAYDVFDARGRRLGWGRAAPDGGMEFFAPDGRRLWTIQCRAGERRCTTTEKGAR